MWEHSRRSIQLGKTRQSGRVFVTLAPRSDPCLFCGLAIEWGVRLLNELIKVKRNILMVCQEAPALLDESQAQFLIYARLRNGLMSPGLLPHSRQDLEADRGYKYNTIIYLKGAMFWECFCWCMCI